MTKHHARCLDLLAAQRIANEATPYIDRFSDGEIYHLDLSTFSSYTQEGLDSLIKHPPSGKISVVTLGFRTLTPAGAHALSRLEAEFLEMPSLISLDADTASYMDFDEETSPLLLIGLEQPLTADTAAVLVEKQSGQPLSLSLPSLNAEVARVLRLHDHETCLYIRDVPPDAEVAALLAHTEGYLVSIDVENELDPVVLQALTSNPHMWVVEVSKKTRGRQLYYVGLPEFIPRVVTPSGQPDRRLVTTRH
jgi:hypothetical protein